MVCEQEMMKQWGKQNFPQELQQHLAQMFPGLSVEEALQHQESLYQSMKTSNVNQAATSSYDQPSSSMGRHSFARSSPSSNGGYDPELDEALARSLQDLDMDYYALDRVSFSETVHITPSTTRQDAGGPSIPAGIQDDINPDEMTYEELQSLTDTVGTESNGLSESVISGLPCHKHKAGFFSKKSGTTGECAVCYTAYKNKESVTTLPCAHQYHTECINVWLRQKKSCPICKNEVV